jgi:hypothetical protein
MANESTIASRSLLPTYESLYGEEGKFPIDPDTVARLRAEAEEQGLIFKGDATTGQQISEFIRNAPDAAYSFLARGAEGVAELATGLALATYKGGRLATETDPEKQKEIMAEPAFTKYLGEFRGALGNLNLGENKISGLSPEKIAGVIGYYTAPVPTGIMAAGARAVPTLVKGAGQVADELATTARFFPEYNPLRKFQPKSVGAMSIDELIESGQIKKASEITDDAENLMAIERDRFQKIAEAKGSKSIIIEVGNESTEGTFRYKGETFNKSNGILKREPDGGRRWIPKDSFLKTKSESSSVKTLLTRDIEKLLKENFSNEDMLNTSLPQLTKFLENQGIIFKSKTPEIKYMKVGKIREELTGQKVGKGGAGIERVPPDEKKLRKPLSILLKEFDEAGQASINNFRNDLIKLTGFNKSLDDSMKVTSPLNRFLNGAVQALKRGDATTDEIIEQLNKVDKDALADILKKNAKIRNKLKKANELGIDLNDLNLSHMEDIADNWKTSLDANNLFLATKDANQKIQVKLDKDIRKNLEKAKKAKTEKEKQEAIDEFNEIQQELIDNNLVSIIDGKKIGADVDFEKTFKKFSEEADAAILERLFKKDGGMMNIFEMTRPLNAQR